MYMFDNYTVKSYLTHPLKPSRVDQPIACLLNALIHGLSENRKHLPGTIVIIPDWDIVKNLDKISYGISQVLEIILNWLIKEIDRAIQTSKDDLLKQKAGTIRYGDPRILWIKMINRCGVIRHHGTIEKLKMPW